MAPITSLPLHLVAEMLRMVGNVQHLPSILLSHRIFYTAYLDNRSLVIDVLRQQLPEDVLALAVAAYTSQASFRQRHGGIDAGRFLSDYYDRPLEAIGGASRLTLDQALYISRLDDALTALRRGFCQATLRKLYGESRDDPATMDDEAYQQQQEQQQLSAGELYRVTRALYRFHIYGNLFLSCRPDNDTDECDDVAEKALFFGRHSPWVNEQLACVYDHLESRLTGVMLTILAATPACREVMVNGFQWGENLTEWLTQRSQLFEEQRCLSLGLTRLHELLQASSYEEWQKSLDEARGLSQSCLEDDLDEFNRGRRPDAGHGVWRVEEMDKLALEVDADDRTDDHPRKMWNKIYYDRVRGRFRFGPHASASMRFIYGLRGIGYVMWDGERMQEDACRTSVSKAYRGDPIF